MLNGCEVKHIQYTTIELPTSPRATQVFCSQHGNSWTATTKAWKGSQFPRLSRSSMCSKHIFSTPTCPFLHSGCPYSRAVSRAHTLDSCTPPGCCILQSGITPGWGNHAWGFMCNRNSCFFFTGWCLSHHSSQNQSSVERCLHMQISHHQAQAHLSCRGIQSNQPTVIRTRESRTLSQPISNSSVKSLPTLKLHHWSAPSAAPTIHGSGNSVKLSNLLNTRHI